MMAGGYVRHAKPGAEEALAQALMTIEYMAATHAADAALLREILARREHEERSISAARETIRSILAGAGKEARNA